MSPAPELHLAIVSHLQGELVARFLADLAACATPFRVTVLSNVPEPVPAVPPALAARVEYVVNASPLGYGANMNKAFRRCEAPFFCVLNPDLRVAADPFPALLRELHDERIAVVAPGATDPSGVLQDNARRLPSPLGIAAKLWGAPRGPDYSAQGGLVFADFVAGFFMLWRSADFRALGGFDEHYFMYYEDLDLCTRARLAGKKVAWLPSTRIVHDARRESHRSARHLSWHLSSMARFFASPVYRAARAGA